MGVQLRSQTLHYSAALLLSRAVTIVFLLVLPAFLSPRDYGVLGLLALATALLAPVLTLELGQGLGRYYPTAEPQEQRALLRTSFTFTFMALALAALLTLLFAPALTGALIGDLSYVDAFRAGMIFCFGNILFMYLQNLLRWQFRSGDFLFLSLLSAALTLGLGLGLGVSLRDALLGVLAGQAIGIGLTLVWCWVRMRSDLRFGWHGGALRRMLRFSLPLVPASLTLFASTYASRLVLQDLTSLEAVGHFTWASQIAALPAMLLLGVQAALTPYVMRHHAEPSCPPLLARGFELVVALQLAASLALGLIAPVLVRLAGYEGYEEAAALVLPLAPAALMLNLYVFAPGFAVGEKSDWQFWVSLASAVAAVTLNYLLIGLAGERGAVLATLISSGLFFLLWFAASQRLYPIPVRWGRLLAIVLLFLLAAWFGSRLPDGSAVELAAAVLTPLVLLLATIALRLVDVWQVKSMLLPRRTAGA